MIGKAVLGLKNGFFSKICPIICYFVSHSLKRERYNFVLFMSSLTDWAMTRWKTLNFKTIKHEEEITGFFILVSGDM